MTDTETASDTEAMSEGEIAETMNKEEKAERMDEEEIAGGTRMPVGGSTPRES